MTLLKLLFTLLFGHVSPYNKLAVSAATKKFLLVLADTKCPGLVVVFVKTTDAFVRFYVP